MPATATIEHLGTMTATSFTVSYVVTDVDDSEDLNDVCDAVRAIMPLFVSTKSVYGDVKVLYVKDISVPFDGGCGTYKVTVSYAANDAGIEPLPSGIDTVISLQISSQQVLKRIFNKDPIGSGGDIVASGGTILDLGTVDEGVPVDEPLVTFIIRKRYASVASGWATALADKVGWTNNAVLFGAAIRCLKYQGATVSDFPETGVTQETEYTHTYLYRATQPAVNYTPAPGVSAISIPAHAGWDWLDIRKAVVKSTASRRLNVYMGYQIIKTGPSGDISP